MLGGYRKLVLSTFGLSRWLFSLRPLGTLFSSCFTDALTSVAQTKIAQTR